MLLGISSFDVERSDLALGETTDSAAVLPGTAAGAVSWRAVLSLQYGWRTWNKLRRRDI